MMENREHIIAIIPAGRYNQFHVAVGRAQRGKTGDD